MCWVINRAGLAPNGNRTTRTRRCIQPLGASLSASLYDSSNLNLAFWVLLRSGGFGDLGDDGTNGGEGGDELLFVLGLVGDVSADDEQGGGLDGGLGEQHPCFARTPSSVSSNPRLTRMF